MTKQLTEIQKKFPIKIKFPKLVDHLGNVESDEDYIKRFPQPIHNGDIGWDITATSVEYDDIYDCYVYHTGIYCETEEGLGCFLMPRSSNAKTEAYLCNQVGLVETFIYRGEFIIKYKNRTSRDVIINESMLYEWASMPWYKKIFKSFKSWYFNRISDAYERYNQRALHDAPYEVGDRIAQIVWLEFPTNFDIEIVDELSETERGEGGFGSTGK